MESEGERNSPSGKSTWRPGSIVLAVVPVLLVLVTFLFWYSSWFGRRLSEGEVEKYLADTSAPRKTQHALSQIAGQMVRGDPGSRRWYAQIVRLGESPDPQLRVTAAWVMGQDNRAEEFHRALLGLVQDRDLMVRWNAALALVRFRDASGRPALRQMLRPQQLPASRAGTVNFIVPEHGAVRSGSIVARLRKGESEPVDLRAPGSGHLEQRIVPEGAAVAEGAAIAVISPGEDQVWEALRALYLVGTPDDQEDVERFAQGVQGMSDRVRQQAALTAQAIRQRSLQRK